MLYVRFGLSDVQFNEPKPTPPPPGAVTVTVSFDIVTDEVYLRIVMARLAVLTNRDYWFQDVGGADVNEVIAVFSEALQSVTPK